MSTLPLAGRLETEPDGTRTRVRRIRYPRPNRFGLSPAHPLDRMVETY